MGTDDPSIKVGQKYSFDSNNSVSVLPMLTFDQSLIWIDLQSNRDSGN